MYKKEGKIRTATIGFGGTHRGPRRAWRVVSPEFTSTLTISEKVIGIAVPSSLKIYSLHKSS